MWLGDETSVHLDRYVNTKHGELEIFRKSSCIRPAGLCLETIGIRCKFQEKKVVGPIFSDTTLNVACYHDIITYFINDFK